jgi:hypothetical protein
MQVILAHHQERHQWWLRSAKRLTSPPCTQLHYKHKLWKITQISSAAFIESRPPTILRINSAFRKSFLMRGPSSFRNFYGSRHQQNVDKQHSSTVQSNRICWHEVQFNVTRVLWEMQIQGILCVLFIEPLPYTIFQYHNFEIIHISPYRFTTIIHKTLSLYITGMYWRFLYTIFQCAMIAVYSLLLH